jgi:hypothetical protein
VRGEELAMKPVRKILSFKPRADAGHLERELEAWREAERRAPAARLSERVRERVLRGATNGGPAEIPFASLFLPTRRFAVAAALPLLVLTVAMGYLLMPGGTLEPAGEEPVRLSVSKQGDEVVFLIADGQRPHRVYRSTSPDVVDRDQVYTTAKEAFRDRLDAGGELVFYRID